jgi:hypothetical protein
MAPNPDEQDVNLAALRELILEAFDTDSFRQLFFFSDNPRLEPTHQWWVSQ